MQYMNKHMEGMILTNWYPEFKDWEKLDDLQIFQTRRNAYWDWKIKDRESRGIFEPKRGQEVKEGGGEGKKKKKKK
jgi:hypothetical protein